MYLTHCNRLLSNGPSTVEVQGRWIADAITKMHRQGIKYINATPEATKAWKIHINDLNNVFLFPTTKSTYMGGSVPGKAFEAVCYAGGIPTYKDEIRGALKEWTGFEVVKEGKQKAEQNGAHDVSQIVSNIEAQTAAPSSNAKKRSEATTS